MVLEMLTARGTDRHIERKLKHKLLLPVFDQRGPDFREDKSHTDNARRLESNSGLSYSKTTSPLDQCHLTFHSLDERLYNFLPFLIPPNSLSDIFLQLKNISITLSHIICDSAF